MLNPIWGETVPPACLLRPGVSADGRFPKRENPGGGEAGVFGRTSTGENLIVRKISNSIFE
jgi:hypothetical protein